MARVLSPLFLLAGGCLIVLGCNGPDSPTTIPVEDRVGLGRPGGEGSGITDGDGNEYPEGLIPDDHKKDDKKPEDQK